MGFSPTANLAVKGITKPPNPESKTARKPRPTHGFLAKSNTCSTQITATDQSLPNSSRATKYRAERSTPSCLNRSLNGSQGDVFRTCGDCGASRTAFAV